MPLSIVDSSVSSAVAVVTSQEAQLSAISAGWPSGDVTVRIRSGATVRSVLTVGRPSMLNTVPRRLSFGARLARSFQAAGDATHVDFLRGSTIILTGTVGSQPGDIQLGVSVSELNTEDLSGLYIEADANLPVSSLPPPVADFQSSLLSGTAPLSVVMTDQSTGAITSREWTVRLAGSVVHTSTATNPTFVLSSAGVYSFELVVTGPGGSATRTRANYVTVSGAAALTLQFDRATPHQIALQAVQGRALASGSAATLYYKAALSSTWISAGPLHRVLQAEVGETISEGFAGFVPGLNPGTTYDVRVDLVEPGQPDASVSAQHTTRSLPPENATQTKTCTPATFASTMAGVVAGDVVVLQNGTYNLSGFSWSSPGTVNQPVVLRGQSRTGVILLDATDAVVILAGSYCTLEYMTIRGSQVDGGGAAPSRGVVMASGRPQNVTLRHLTFDGLDRAVKAFVPVDGLLVYDCEFLGNNAWSQVATEDATGAMFNDDAVGMPGQGNCLWNCTIQGHGDVVKLTTGSGNTERSRACFAHSNWVKWSGDDFFEADDVGGNCGAYDNVVCNTTTAISAADTFGGPVALLRNVFINQARHPLKLNGVSQGTRVLNNTFVSTTKITTDQDYGIRVPTSTNYRLDMRNNLVVYRGAGGLMKWGGSLPNCVTDYNAWFPSDKSIEFGSGTGLYASLAAAKTALAPRMANDVAAESDPFLSAITLGATYATRYDGIGYAALKSNSTARAAGVAIPGATDGYTGAAPDIGAVITGRGIPAVGCSWSSPVPAWAAAAVSATWMEVPMANTLASLDPAQNPALNPDYVGGTSGNIAVWNLNGGKHPAIMYAWNGASFDHILSTMWIALAGGHSDYGGNEIYEGNFLLNSPAWRIVRPPSGSIPVSSGILLNDLQEGKSGTIPSGPFAGNPWAGAYSDGRPRSIHTYHAPFFWPGVGHGMAGLPAQFYEPARNTTTYPLFFDGNGEHVVGGSGTLPQSATLGMASCYDSTRNCIWAKGNGNTPMYRYDKPSGAIQTGQYQSVGGTYPISGDLSMVYLPEHDCILVGYSSFTTGVYGFWRIFDCATGQWYEPPVVGSGAADTNTNGRASLWWVPEIGKVCTWNNSTNRAVITTITMPANPRAQALTVSTLAVDPSNSVVPTPAQANGTYGRFAYAPRLRGFLLINNTTGPVFFYKL